MDYYDIDEIIKTASTEAIDISPSDRQEWVFLCCALKVLGYSVNTFIAISNTTAAECRKVWNAEKKPSRYVPTEDKAKAKIVALAKAAGMNLNPYKIQTGVKPPAGVNRGNRGKTGVNRGKRGKTGVTGVKGVTGVNDFEGIDLSTLETPQQPPLKIELEEINRKEDKAEHSALYNFLCRLFPPDEVNRVFQLYRIGATEEFNTVAPALASAFPYLNASGDCVDIHLMPYDKDGHRRKEGYNQNWLLAKRKQSDRRGEWCLFGEHLLNLNPSAPVGVVESEKTALIAAIVAPGYVWAATGSLNNLNARRCKELKGRAVYIFPDIDGISEWRKKAKALQQEGFNIFFCSEYITAHASDPKDDLGDIICKWQEKQRGGVEV